MWDDLNNFFNNTAFDESSLQERAQRIKDREAVYSTKDIDELREFTLKILEDWRRLNKEKQYLITTYMINK